jgi:hypothetical protein|nr:MAG TPA: repressor protein CI [Caudoviricetes sp.]
MNEIQINLLKDYILEDLEKTRKSDISAKEKAELEISALRALVELENSPVAARIDKAYEAFTTQQNEIDINKNFYDKVAEYCGERKMPISAFEKMCSIGNGTCGRWRDSMSSPTLTTMQKIAEATKIPVEKWIK